jgi:hypothetical protein
MHPSTCCYSAAIVSWLGEGTLKTRYMWMDTPIRFYLLTKRSPHGRAQSQWRVHTCEHAILAIYHGVEGLEIIITKNSWYICKKQYPIAKYCIQKVFRKQLHVLKCSYCMIHQIRLSRFSHDYVHVWILCILHTYVHSFIGCPLLTREMKIAVRVRPLTIQGSSGSFATPHRLYSMLISVQESGVIIMYDTHQRVLQF